MQKTEQDQKKKKTLLIFLIVILFVISAVGVVYLVWIYYNNYMAESTYNNLPESYSVTQSEQTPELPENPIDFEELQKINDEIYAWITVPNTKIDYPIVQNEVDDYYLRRSIYDKYLTAGSIFTNKSNSKDFTDPVTVIYGHNMRNDTMFCMLHEFENKEFFDNNEFFYIFTPGHKYTYRVVSALKYDNRRITAAYDFSDNQQLESFQYSITNPKYDLFNSRDVKLTDDDKIVTLSTCVANKPKYRYLVNGVLVKDELTK